MSSSSLRGLLLAGGVLAGVYYYQTSSQPPAPTPAPAPPAKPAPKPAPKPKRPNCPNCPMQARIGRSLCCHSPASRAPWALSLSSLTRQPPNACPCGCNPCLCGPDCPCFLRQAGGKPVKGSRASPDGAVEICLTVDEIDWPKNIASRGLGCCGFRSIDYCARVQNVPELINLPEQMRDAGIAGGDYPSKHAEVTKKFAPDVQWWQDSGKHIELMEASLKSMRPCCCDYNGHDPHYSGQIAHCVTCVACDVANDWVAILDNNYPSLDEIVWMSVAEFKQRWSGWSYGLLAVTPGHVPEHVRNWRRYTAEDMQAGPLFGLQREGHPWGDDSSLNFAKATPADILAAIGPEMRPITIEPVKIDHQIDLENLKVPAMLAVLVGFGFWLSQEQRRI